MSTKDYALTFIIRLECVIVNVLDELAGEWDAGKRYGAGEIVHFVYSC